MTTVSSNPDPDGSEAPSTQTDIGIHYYGVKIEVSVKDPSKTVQGKAILSQTIKQLEKTQKNQEQLIFLDVNGIPISSELKGINKDDIGKRFCMTLAGPSQKTLLFGLGIRTDIPYKDLKDRSLPFFNEYDIYMKPHFVGFEHGVNWMSIGFLMELHPTVGNLPEVTEQLRTTFDEGWSFDDQIWTNTKKEEFLELMDENEREKFTPKEFPIALVPNSVTATNSQGQRIRAYSTTVMVPFGKQAQGKTIMDYVFLEQNSFSHYVPIAFRNEDKDEFYNLVQQQATWMENHRNIQILNVPDIYHFNDVPSPYEDGYDSLYDMIIDVEGVYSAQFDAIRQRVNVSVTLEKYMSTVESLEKALKKNEFPFKPKIRKPASKPTNYAQALAFHKETRKTQAAYVSSGNQNNRTWAQRTIPREINFEDSSDFPFLPRKSTEVPQPDDTPEPREPRVQRNRQENHAVPTQPAQTKRPDSPRPTFQSEPAKRPDSPTPTYHSTSDSVSASVLQKSIDDAVSSITTRYQQEMDELRSEMKQMSTITETLVKLEHQQHELTQQLLSRSRMEQQMTEILAFFKEQMAFDAAPKEDKFEPARKRSIQRHTFRTPQTTPEKLPRPPNPTNSNPFSVFEGYDEDTVTMEEDRMEVEQTTEASSDTGKSRKENVQPLPPQTSSEKSSTLSSLNDELPRLSAAGRKANALHQTTLSIFPRSGLKFPRPAHNLPAPTGTAHPSGLNTPNRTSITSVRKPPGGSSGHAD